MHLASVAVQTWHEGFGPIKVIHRLTVTACLLSVQRVQDEEAAEKRRRAWILSYADRESSSDEADEQASTVFTTMMPRMRVVLLP